MDDAQGEEWYQGVDVIGGLPGYSEGGVMALHDDAQGEEWYQGVDVIGGLFEVVRVRARVSIRTIL